jgi:DNA-binding transcriptional LysR family regulator
MCIGYERAENAVEAPGARHENRKHQMRSIPIDVLRAFIAVVEARGFTRAAEELGRTQPTISLQVKRLEEVVEAPLFNRTARFELSAVGEVCFKYGKRLLRLHDELLDEAARASNPNATLRIGVAREFNALLAPRLSYLRADAKSGEALNVTVEDSQALLAAFRQNALDVVFVVGSDEKEPHTVAQWRAALCWYGRGLAVNAASQRQPLRLAIGPQGSPLHEAAVGALRTTGRKFDIVCMSSDYAVLAAAAGAGIGVTPMFDGMAPEGLKTSLDKSLPQLPNVILSLLARSQSLADLGRRWVASIVEPLQPI